jgi:shikimate kinase
VSAKVVLIGPMAAGKTKVGKRVAKVLGAQRYDTDKVFVTQHGEIAAFFAEHGEPAFRAIEAALVRETTAEPAVVSLGGGAVLDPASQAVLAHLPVVYLTVSPDAVASRLGEGKRPLVADEGVVAWERIFEARRPIYERLAKRTYDTSRGNLDEIAEDIAAWVMSGYQASKKDGL